MRIITRPDFDGIVCAVLLCEALDINEKIYWVEPNAMHSGQVAAHNHDIIANLAYHPNCLLWFDHHVTNRVTVPFNGAFKIAPSAASIVFDYLNRFDCGNLLPHNTGIACQVKKFKRDYTELVAAADKIDSAQLTLDEVEHPGKYPYVLLSMSIFSHISADEPYWNRLVELLRKYEIQEVLKDPKVKWRTNLSLKENKTYAAHLKKHTTFKGDISITDFRSFKKMPIGNRFLVFSLFPETSVNVKIRHHDDDREKIIVSIAHNIFNRRCNVNAGLLCARFEGGGHFGAGSCSFPVCKTDEYLPVIINTMLKNNTLEN
ncbi:MAG: Exopolyphosphatase [Acidobacteriota bacterium]|nr:Exopolyphosphatase [Acidobacteriota bacterium]